MSEYVIMPLADYKAACNTIRSVTGKTDLIKSGDFSSETDTIASKVGKAVFKSTTMPYASRWSSVVYGDGKFVAISYIYGYAAYSTDGIAWIETTLPNTNSRWVAVTYGDGKFVAVAEGSSKAAYSTDGVSWIETALPSFKTWNSVAYGAGKFVAVADSIGAYSTDGILWHSITSIPSGVWRSVTYGKDTFVVVPYSSTSFEDKSAYCDLNVGIA